MKENIPVSLQIAVLAVQVGVIIFGARFAGNLIRKLHIPPVLGELLAGVLLGPFLLGSIPLGIHGFENGLFPLTGGSLPVSTPLYALSTFGSIILLFISGLETDLKQFFRYSLTGSVVGIGGAAVSFIFGALFGLWMFEGASILDPRVLFLGILSTATSVGITARILSERKTIDSPEGTTILAAAVIDDVLGIICLAIVMGIVGVSAGQSGQIDWGKIGFIAVKSFGIWLGVTALGLCFAHKIAAFLKCFRPGATFSILAFGLALLAAGLFESAGLAMIIGAYVMGLSLSKTDIAFSIHRNISSISNFLVPIFFVVMGMLIDVRVFGNMEVLAFGLIYSVLAIIAKIIGCALPARMLNFNTIGSLRIGMGMIPRGEVALIIAGIGATTMMTLNGKQIPIINAELFGIAIIMTLVTTIAAPPLLSFMLNIKKSGVKKTQADSSSVHTVYDFPSEMIRDVVLTSMMEHFRSEGFRNSSLSHDTPIIHFRRKDTSFSMQINGNSFDFESSLSESVLIKSIIFETFVEIQRAISELKNFTISGVISPPTAEDINNSIRHMALPPEKILSPDHIIKNLQGETLKDAIIEIIDLLYAQKAIANPELCINSIIQRENIVSTCTGNIALPHARVKGVSGVVSVLGVSPKGLIGNNKKINIVLLTLSPPDFDNPYLQYIGHAASVLVRQENVERIINASSPEEISNLFEQKTRK